MQDYANSMTCRVKVANMEPLILVRLPDYVSAAVASVAPGSEIGTIVFRRAAAAASAKPASLSSSFSSPPSPSSAVVEVEALVRLNSSVVRGVPSQYAARVRPETDPTVVFTQRAADRVISVQGSLTDVLDVKPLPGPEYSDFLRQRSRQRVEAQPIRVISHHDHKQLSGRSFSTVFTAERRARGDLATVRRQVLELFEEQPHWRLDDASSRLKQPLEFVRSILDTVADLHRTGALKGAWELKPELRSLRSLEGTHAPNGASPLDAVDDEEYEDV